MAAVATWVHRAVMSAASNHRSLNDEIIAAIEGPLFDEDDVQQARDYLATLQALDAYQTDWTEDDVTLARDYLRTLTAIDELGKPTWSEDDVNQAREYLQVLTAIDEAR
jgi:hypothetical protein